MSEKFSSGTENTTNKQKSSSKVAYQHHLCYFVIDLSNIVTVGSLNFPFSSPELKDQAPVVRRPSVCELFLFSPSSQEPLHEPILTKHGTCIKHSWVKEIQVR